jgi:hypothetical protein
VLRIGVNSAATCGFFGAKKLIDHEPLIQALSLFLFTATFKQCSCFILLICMAAMAGLCQCQSFVLASIYFLSVVHFSVSN